MFRILGFNGDIDDIYLPDMEIDNEIADLTESADHFEREVGYAPKEFLERMDACEPERAYIKGVKPEPKAGMSLEEIINIIDNGKEVYPWD